MSKNFLPTTGIRAFAQLGEIMRRASKSLKSEDSAFASQYPALNQALEAATQYNPWFTPSSIAMAFEAWGNLLTQKSITEWMNGYKNKTVLQPKEIAVIMAGNIPIVGFHDFLCVMMSGHHFIGKLSSDDKILLPALANELIQIEPAFGKRIQFTETTIKHLDAIIATGSNNTARYFEYYFSKYPHIIRKNRNGVAVLSGLETEDTLQKFGNDICSYFGLGCRNVSKVFIPAGFEPQKLFKAIEPYHDSLFMHNKYMNNYNYHRSVLLLNQVKHQDNGVFLLTESKAYASPIPVLYYEFYNNPAALITQLENDGEQIQCIVTDVFTNVQTVNFGQTQFPGLGDYADGTDTMAFLLQQ